MQAKTIKEWVKEDTGIDIELNQCIGCARVGSDIVYKEEYEAEKNKYNLKDKKISPRRVKRVVVDPKFLFDLLYSNRTVFIYNELPEECKFEDVVFNYLSRKINLIISNDKFEEVAEGEIIPEFDGEILVKEMSEDKK
jgi:hypothetical protein